ncbi:unnamed protein product [Polarella glacialis]|uniref:Uncharacterized protein n=1 Tax=Polarella glacialis TaxID=89957 RepID=A0A813F1A2_POLGL|nr:unnamed protein product [Polarella glacialis]
MEEAFIRPRVASYAGPTAVARMAMTQSWPRDSDGLAWHKSASGPPSLPVLQDMVCTWQSSWKMEPQDSSRGLSDLEEGASVEESEDAGSDSEDEDECLLNLLHRLIGGADFVSDTLLDVICIALVKLQAARAVAGASSMQNLRRQKMELMAKALGKGFGSICYLLADRCNQFDSCREYASKLSHTSGYFGTATRLRLAVEALRVGEAWEIDSFEEPSAAPDIAFRHVKARPQLSALLFLLDRCQLDVRKPITRYRPLHRRNNNNLASRGHYLCEGVDECLSHTALGFASQAGHVSLVQLLLERSSDVNQLGKIDFYFSWNGYVQVSALLLAVQEQHLQVVQLLLRHGARTHQHLRKSIRCIEPLGHFVDSFVTPLSCAHDHCGYSISCGQQDAATVAIQQQQQQHQQQLFELLLRHGEPSVVHRECREVIAKHRSQTPIHWEGTLIGLEVCFGRCKFCCEEPGALKRRAKDCRPCTRVQFEYYYGLSKGAEMWNAALYHRNNDNNNSSNKLTGATAKKSSVEKRKARDGCWYTKQQFEGHYGSTMGSKMWSAATWMKP